MDPKGDKATQTTPEGSPPSAESAEAAAVLLNADNRRGHARLPFGVRVLAHELDDNGVPGEATVCDGHDISRSGLGIRSRRMFYEGRKVILMVCLPAMQPRFMFGEVRYSRYTYRGQYHVGIQLCAMPQTEAIRAWTQAQQSAA